ncbi:unnamed protein product, partial [Laminaria digitata]
VVNRGYTDGRRVSGIFREMFMVGTRHECKDCHAHHKTLKVPECNDDDDEEKQRRVAALKQHSYMFQSYDPAVTKLYTERFPWIGATNKAIVCTKKTAMSVELAYLLKRWLTSG